MRFFLPVIPVLISFLSLFQAIDFSYIQFQQNSSYVRTIGVFLFLVFQHFIVISKMT